MAPKRLSRQESQLQTRERLLEAAASVFSQRGFYEASVDEVAEEAGFSKGAVYSNFASKEELFLVLLDRHLEAEFKKIASQFTQKENAQETEAETVETSGSFAAELEETRIWNMLSFRVFALRHTSPRNSAAASGTVSRSTQRAHILSTENVSSTGRSSSRAYRIHTMGHTCDGNRTHASSIFRTRCSAPRYVFNTD